MRDPCPYCGLRGISLSHVGLTGEVYRDIKDHNCPAWAPKPALSIFDTDTSFIREARNTVEGLSAWREQLR